MKIQVSLLAILLSLSAMAQRDDKVLKSKLEALVNGFHGDIGVYVRNLKTNKVVAIRADTIFPTASMIKVPIAIGVFDKIEKGEIAYNAELTYRDSLLYEGTDILGS